ncbi:MAG: hypothetical protein AAB289_13675, partial [Chloroflexota bacterium]
IWSDQNPDGWRRDFETWRGLGATHITPTKGPAAREGGVARQTGTGGFSSIRDRLDALRRFIEAVK